MFHPDAGVLEEMHDGCARSVYNAIYLAASGGQSGWLDGWAARNAGWLSSSLSMRKMIGYGLKSTWNLDVVETSVINLYHDLWLIERNHVDWVDWTHLRALNTCGTKQQSAKEISSPTQNLPADVDNSFSMARKPLVIQCCAHSFFFSSPTWMSTMRFCNGWMPDVITSHISRTLARLCTSWGKSGRCGRVSSR